MKIIRKSTIPEIGSFSFLDAFTEKIKRVTDSINAEDYKFSKYNIIKNIDGKHVVYNMASDAVLILDDYETSDLIVLENEIPKLPNEILKTLVEQGVLIDKEVDEDLVLAVIRQNQITNPVNEFKIAINTTYVCNARCDYCFEYGADHSKMTYDVADQVVDYICKSINKDTVVTYRWFGGEPLLAVDIIDRIISKVNERFDSKLNYRSVILSNGTIYNDDILHKIFSEWNVYEFHVTLDGNKETHNKKKNFYVEDFDGYTKVMNLVKTLLEKDIIVACRINIDKNNINSLNEIVEQFKGYSNKELLNIYAAPVRRHTKTSESYCFDYTEYNEMFDKIYLVLHRHDLLASAEYIVPKRKVTCCSTRATNEIVIDTKGKLYKCMQTATNDQYSVGNCNGGLTYNKELSKWLVPQTPIECLDCYYMPICQAGCKGFRSLNNPLVSPCVNERHYLDTILKYVCIMSEEEKK